jgi:hypothetical protein
MRGVFWAAEMKEGALRIAAIGWIGVALACAAATSPVGEAAASPAGGSAANQRGMGFMRQKKWADAEAEFRKAIAEDPTSVTAHYNLACAASRAHDADTALWELAWVGDRATWVDQAKAAARKAPSDDDLAWAIGNDINAQLFIGDAPVAAVTEIATPAGGHNAGHALAEPQRAKIAAILAAAPGPHDDQCDAADAKQGKVFALGLDLGKWAKGIGVASLKDGVAVLDPQGAIAARSEPLGCTGPGASQDLIAALAYADGVPTPPRTTHALPEADLQLLAVLYTTGGRRTWQTNVAVFAQNGKSLAKVFEALVTSSDAPGSGHVWQTPLGHLLYSAPGETRKHAFQWDPKAFKFVPLP